MKINRSEVFKTAWKRARADMSYRVVVDLAEGKGRSLRAPTAAERRALFSRYLRKSWAEAKRRAQLAQGQAAPRGVADISAELIWLENKDYLRGGDLARLEALRSEFHQARTIAA